MSKFTTFNISYDPEINFWEQNPHMIYIPPFNEMYNSDKGGMTSSKYMWTIGYFSHPDEDENKYFKFGKEGVEKMIIETGFFPELDIENELYNKCGKDFPYIALDSVQRDLYNKKMHLRDRANFLSGTEYTLENSKKLDDMHAKTAKIMDEYDQILERYMETKLGATIKGGRQRSKSEKGEI